MVLKLKFADNEKLESFMNDRFKDFDGYFKILKLLDIDGKS